jgi:hypothetical protein
LTMVLLLHMALDIRNGCRGRKIKLTQFRREFLACAL